MLDIHTKDHKENVELK